MSEYQKSREQLKRLFKRLIISQDSFDRGMEIVDFTEAQAERDKNINFVIVQPEDTPYAGYGWRIDVDHVDNKGPTYGPRDLDPVVNTALNDGRGEKFRMYDDDGILYYEGRIIHVDGYEAPDEGFEPLDDYGTPNAGAVDIHYRNPKTGEWSPL